MIYLIFLYCSTHYHIYYVQYFKDLSCSVSRFSILLQFFFWFKGVTGIGEVFFSFAAYVCVYWGYLCQQAKAWVWWYDLESLWELGRSIFLYNYWNKEIARDVYSSPRSNQLNHYYVLKASWLIIGHLAGKSQKDKKWPRMRITDLKEPWWPAPFEDPFPAQTLQPAIWLASFVWLLLKIQSVAVQLFITLQFPHTCTHQRLQLWE